MSATPTNGDKHGPRPMVNPAPVPAASYAPTDTTIPQYLYDKIPFLDQYKQLLDAEKKIDLAIASKALDLQAYQQKSVHPNNLKGDSGILRVFVYNTCENQPWQAQLARERSETVAETVPETQGDPSWTLRVEGKYISDSKNSFEGPLPSFSSLLSALSIDLIPNQHYPSLQAPESHIIEWREDVPDAMGKVTSTNFDGLDVKRNGMYDLDAKIALMIKSSGQELVLSDSMAQFAGKKEATQQELIYLVWKYALQRNLIRKNDALTTVPAVPEQPIAAAEMDAAIRGGDITANDVLVADCDPVLATLLGVQSFKFQSLYHLLLSHFKPREPIVLDYHINTRKSTTLGEMVFDIPVQLPINIAKVQRDLIEFNKSRFESNAKADMQIQKTQQKIQQAIAALQNADMRERFYRELSENPVEFIERWLVSQAETLKALKSDEGYDEEVVRHSQYFQDNEHLIKDKISLMLGASRF